MYDLNGDGIITSADYNMARGDLNGDGIITSADYNIARGLYGGYGGYGGYRRYGGYGGYYYYYYQLKPKNIGRFFIKLHLIFQYNIFSSIN